MALLPLKMTLTDDIEKENWRTNRRRRDRAAYKKKWISSAKVD